MHAHWSFGALPPSFGVLQGRSYYACSGSSRFERLQTEPSCRVLAYLARSEPPLTPTAVPGVERGPVECTLTFLILSEFSRAHLLLEAGPLLLGHILV